MIPLIEGLVTKTSVSIPPSHKLASFALAKCCCQKSTSQDYQSSKYFKANAFLQV